MSLNNRIEKYHTLRKLLKYITTNVYDVCVNGNTEFTKKLDEINEIGSGSLGNVYLASLNNHTFVIKESQIENNHDEEKIKNNKKSIEILPFNSYVEEYIIMELLSDYVGIGGFPNFILSYKAAVCETCEGKYSKSCFMTFMEPAMCNLDEFIKIQKNIFSKTNAFYSIVYQLFLSLCVIHFKYGIYQYDISPYNILVLEIEPGGYLKYILNGKEYFVENHGYLFCIHDFGQSQVLHPDYSSREFYGTRNVLVNQDGKLEPIYRDENTDVIKWDDGRIGTYNVFTSESIPGQQVDLTDMKTFPPIEFFDDIKDLIRVFTDLAFNVSGDGIISPKQIEKLYQFRNYKFKYDENSAIFLRADMMLDYLYEKPIGAKESKVKDIFYF
jgi:hypothetical protein